MGTIQKIQPCLWFDDQAEEAARYYISVFKNSSITAITHYGKEGFEIHQRPEGQVMTVNFSLDGCQILAMNGGPLFKFSEAISLAVQCESQAEIDYFWERLGAGGDPKAQQCGWLKDRYGLSWQIVPANLDRIFGDGNRAGAERAMKALLGMKKIDMAALNKAASGS